MFFPKIITYIQHNSEDRNLNSFTDHDLTLKLLQQKIIFNDILIIPLTRVQCLSNCGSPVLCPRTATWVVCSRIKVLNPTLRNSDPVGLKCCSKHLQFNNAPTTFHAMQFKNYWLLCYLQTWIQIIKFKYQLCHTNGRTLGNTLDFLRFQFIHWGNERGYLIHRTVVVFPCVMPVKPWSYCLLHIVYSISIAVIIINSIFVLSIKVSIK